MTVQPRWHRWSQLAATFLVAAMVVAAVFHNEFRAQNWDPMQTRVYVQRTLHFGGTFYENGLVNKGPVEPFVYRVATALTSGNGFWYAISAIIAIVSGVLAWAASATTRAFGGHRLLGRAVGIGVFFHFALGRADYAGALYSRNMVVGLYAGAWLIAITPRWWTGRRALCSAALVGVLLGLGIQTLFVSTIAALGVAVVAWSSIELVDSAGDDRLYRRSRRILVATPVLVVAACPVYYLVRGRLTEFWSGYWTYNQYQNVATGRSLANQLVYGRDVILRYYRAWPMSFVIVVAFVAITTALWTSSTRRRRALHVGISVWFVGAWAELVAGQRYSSHYFSILAVPTALMAATVVGHVYRLIERERGAFRSAAAWPLVAGLLSIASGGGQHLTLGLEAASSFTSVNQVAAARLEAEPGPQRTVRAVMDLVSRPGDPLLAWTEFPWVYLNYHRTAATRWIWKSFLLGQVYLGRSSPDYVLPETWTWFAQDMAEADPPVFLEETALPVATATPFAMYVAGNFEPVYTDAATIVHLRNDSAEAVLRGGPTTQPLTPTAALGATSNWTIGAGAASSDALRPSLTDVIGLADSRCTRISGTYRTTDTSSEAFLSFRFDGVGASVGNVRLNVAGGAIFSGSDTAIFDTTYLDGAGPPLVDQGDATATSTTTAAVAAGPSSAAVAASHDFAVVVGDRSAALVVDGAIHAAVRLHGQSHLSLEVRAGGVSLTDLRRGDPPAGSGCPQH